MDDAKYPAFDTKPYRIVKSRSEASVPVNVAPTYYIVASDLQGFPLQQAMPLVQMSTNAQLAPRPTSCEFLANVLMYVRIQMAECHY